jgi:hypothetical protein
VNEKIILGTWSEEKFDGLIAEASKTKDIGERIAFLSGHFLGTPYKESTLIGNASAPEILVMNIEVFDCFTFLDCIEAMRLSRSFVDFRKNLIRIRYKGDLIRYEKRNHFFTDWSICNTDFIQDITRKIGGKRIKTSKKILNRKDDGSYFLPGVGLFERIISYIPSERVNKTICLQLRTGDYVGVYSNLSGLDVSHVGIMVKSGAGIYFRHASSAAQKVVDQDFSEYISGKPGIIILRPY